MQCYSLLTGDEDHWGGWVAGPAIVERSDLDGVNLSAAHWRQGAGAGGAVTG